jgi:RNA polymerase sigma-70 factor (ECF subfamily)
MDLAASTPQPGASPGERVDGVWVEPISDERVVDPTGDPAVVAAQRESVRLAFVAALQLLPSKQRSVLILCEVLQWPAAEAASLLGTTVASVTSALQRGRATLAQRRDEPLLAVDDPAHAELVARYVDAFERYDIGALVALLRDDAVLSMPPYPLWLSGRRDVGAWFAEQGIGCRGARLVPIPLSGTAGFGNYRRTGPGLWEPFGIQVLEIGAGGIVGHHNFLEPSWFTRFGLPERLGAGTAV